MMIHKLFAAGAIAVSAAAFTASMLHAPALAFADVADVSAVSMGRDPLGADDQDPVTIFYPSRSAAQVIGRAPFTLRVAPHGEPAPGNGRLVVISHGSGGAPWVHSDLARALVEAGYVVALPQHHGDNHRHGSRPGPDSWKLRPAEVSRAIDQVAADPRFAALKFDKVGVYGMSAGGHTALSMAGGRWSPAGFKRHCDANLREDFQTCVGLATRLRGNALDGLKLWLARTVIGWKFDDDTPQAHHDPRVTAVVAGVPLAADFDMATLAEPRVPLALVTAAGDAWLKPRFHSDAVLRACLPRCEHLVEITGGGHGALLSPLPPGFDGLEGDLLNDPPGFDRKVLPAIDRKIVGFFDRYLRGIAAVAPHQRSATNETPPTQP